MRDHHGLHEYGYDPLYQIIQATHPTVQNPLGQFTYDAAGNRLTDLTHSAYQYNELNQLTEDDGCWHLCDLDGNQVQMILKALSIVGRCLFFGLFWYIILDLSGSYVFPQVGRAIFSMDMVAFVGLLVSLLLLGLGTTLICRRWIDRHLLPKVAVIGVVLGGGEHEAFYVVMGLLPASAATKLLAMSNGVLIFHPVIYFSTGVLTAITVLKLCNVISHVVKRRKGGC
jgi:hypothetical protein